MREKSNGVKVIFLCLLIVLLIWVAKDYLALFWGSINYRVSASPGDADFSSYGNTIQAGPTISIQPEVRVFTLYAFLNGVAGFDEETGVSMTTARTQLKNDLQKAINTVNPQEVNRWKNFYQSHPADRWSYLYYTLTLGVPPVFPHIVLKADLIEAKTVFYLDGFNQILTSFYLQCHIQELYDQYHGNGFLTDGFAYDTERIQRDFDLIYHYPGIPSQFRDYIKVHIIPNPFETHYYAYSAFYGHTLYIIDGPDSIGEGLNIHEYLHALINPMVLKYARQNMALFDQVFRANQTKKIVRENYNDPKGFIMECLVRATDHRIRLRGDLSKSQYDELEKNDMEQGLVLVPYFSGRLEAYEQTGPYDLEAFIKKAMEEYSQSSI